MKRELIEELFAKFETARYTAESFEFWSVRELQKHFGYTNWRDKADVRIVEFTISGASEGKRKPCRFIIY